MNRINRIKRDIERLKKLKADGDRSEKIRATEATAVQYTTPFTEEVDGWDVAGFDVVYLRDAIESSSIEELNDLFELTRLQEEDITMIRSMRKWLKTPDGATSAERELIEKGVAFIDEMVEPRKSDLIRKKFAEVGKFINEVKRRIRP